ncbi:hypothetical protein TRIUR3_23420 [Triticum urartu]|uniref:Uncharacterized protein n=1 Tax=Triticum urartu TaxID=4572 RepID=M7YML4_TRIUA|nr:hypothetical protein TRIUR3_23420 [Triticum urartu]
MRRDNRKMGFLTLGLARKRGVLDRWIWQPSSIRRGSTRTGALAAECRRTGLGTRDGNGDVGCSRWGGPGRAGRVRRQRSPNVEPFGPRRTWGEQQVSEGSTGLGRGAPARLGRSSARGTAHGRTTGHGSMAQAGGSMAVAAMLVAGQRTAEHNEEARNGQVGCGGGPERWNPKERRLGGGRPDLERAMAPAWAESQRRPWRCRWMGSGVAAGSSSPVWHSGWTWQQVLRRGTWLGDGSCEGTTWRCQGTRKGLHLLRREQRMATGMDLVGSEHEEEKVVAAIRLGWNWIGRGSRCGRGVAAGRDKPTRF